MSIQNIQEDALLTGLLAAKPEALVSTADQAELLKHYHTVSVPTKKVETYRYSSLSKQFSVARAVAQSNDISAEGIAKHILPGINSFAVFVNGVFNADLSVLETDNVVIAPLTAGSASLKKTYTDKFSALNAAFATSGVSITVAKNKAAEDVLQLLFISTAQSATIANVKNVITAEENSSAKIVSVHVSDQSELLTNIHTDVIVGENASLELNVFTNESDTNIQVNNITVDQHKKSVFTGNILSLNSGSIRTNLLVDQNGEFCETNLNGLYLSSRTQHFDNYAFVNHINPNGTTNEVFKGIAKDKSTGVFAGTIYVAPDAQKTLANQSNKNVLLSDDATIHSKPQLEIYADDVSCSHGSTTGQLDKEQIFYMQSRGLNRDKAIHLLLAAFFGDVTEKLTIDALKDKVAEVIVGKI